MKGRKWLFAIGPVLLVLLCLLFFWRAKGGTQTEAYAVAVRAKDSAGQGVVYREGEDGVYVVTAAHVLEGLTRGDTCTLTCADGRDRPAEIFYISETADAGFLYMESAKTGVAPVPFNRASFDCLKVGDALFLIDFDGKKTVRTEGTVLEPWIYVEDFSLYMLLAGLPAKSGMSGCAVVDKNGDLVGILCGVNEEKEAAVLPLSVIESEWIMAR